MIIKLYKSEGNWCFDYKQKTHIISGINRLLDSFCNIADVSKIYIKLKQVEMDHFPNENEYLCYLSTWPENNKHQCHIIIRGHNFQTFARILDYRFRVWADVEIFPFINTPTYMIVTKIK